MHLKTYNISQEYQEIQPYAQSILTTNHREKRVFFY
jgi:hypothetical protein